MHKQDVLREKVSQLFREKGQIEALVLTSFGLDMRYLEQFILPAFFPHLGEGPADEPHLPLFEYLEETPVPISVYYDANNLLQNEQPLSVNDTVIKELRWQAHPVAMATGCFHPKLILALLRQTPNDLPVIIVGCGSANLTRAGWAKNLEACAFEVLDLSHDLDIRSGLAVDILHLIKQLSSYSSESTALARIAEALAAALSNPNKTHTHNNKHRARLWFGQENDNLHAWLNREGLLNETSNNTSGDEWALDILSPYYGERPPTLLTWANNKLVAKRHPNNFQPKVACFCPQTNEHYDLNPETVKALASLSNITWGTLPADSLRSQLKDPDGNALQRFMHAKVYRFWNKHNELLIVGSANATSQGHHEKAYSHNAEACLVFFRQAPAGIDFQSWLQPLTTPIDLNKCKSVTNNEDSNEIENMMPRVDICFDWRSKELIFKNESKQTVDLRFAGQAKPLLTLSANKETCKVLDKDGINNIFNSPTVKVSLANAEDLSWIYLVQERNLSDKPPAPRMDRNVEDLIRDWQSSFDERIASYITRAAEEEESNGEGLIDQNNQTPQDVSNPLNDIFLATYKFRKDTEQALDSAESLDEFQKSRIHSRLFGNGIMSVHYFVQKICSDVSNLEKLSRSLEPVEAFIALLSVNEAVGTLPAAAALPEYPERMNDLQHTLKDAISDVQKILKQELTEHVGARKANKLIRWAENNFSFVLKRGHYEY
ncbi:MAG: hypothetical protein CML17_08010 [Pusillimonas sp.]|nr:hypothetical protein [Pusillimonas sp.]